METHCDIVLLAAGASTRLGSPKQLLLYRQQSLLQHAVELAMASMADRVIVVLGANAASIITETQNSKLSFIINPHWAEGMAASIRCGLSHSLMQNPVPQQVLFMACDQPHINTDLLDKLITSQRTSSCLIAGSQYAATIGIPAVFAASLFPDLLQLKGDTGARKLIQQYKDQVLAIPFEPGAVDIDTAADYRGLQKNEIEK